MLPMLEFQNSEEMTPQNSVHDGVDSPVGYPWPRRVKKVGPAVQPWPSRNCNDLPNEDGDFPSFFVCLPEGNSH